MSIELLRLLQLTNASLPIGAFSYSEGIESLVDAGKINDPHALQTWLGDGLAFGTVRIEAGVMLRAYRATVADDAPAVRIWNDWLAASRETRELHDQSVQMGRSLSFPGGFRHGGGRLGDPRPRRRFGLPAKLGQQPGFGCSAAGATGPH
jgi:urease accessory protein UreF